MSLASKIIEGVAVGVGTLAIIAGISLLLAFPIKWVWNFVMPYLFGLKTISWGMAWCLSFLSTALIKSNHTIKS